MSHSSGRTTVRKSTALIRVVVLCAAVQAFAQSAGPTFPDPGKPSMSRQDQQALGMKAAAQIYQEVPVLPDSSPETKYIRQLGQKLVATIPSQYSWPFEFHVVAQSDINAFALPGGQMFVNLGTILAATRESELAGVMAHEMSHVYMQHSAKQAGKAQKTGVFSALASAALGMSGAGDIAGGLVGQLGQMGIQIGAQGIMMKYSRGDESQADAVGAIILYKAGYNPQGMADFFKILGTQSGGAPPIFFASHPPPGDRQQAIRKEIQNWPPVNYAEDSPAFAQARQHAAGVKTYSAEEIQRGAESGQWTQLNQRNGAVFNPNGPSVIPTAAEAAAPASVSPVALQSVAPSRRMAVAEVGPIAMNRPDNWALKLPEQPGQFATIAPRAGIAGDGVGYGVLLNGVSAKQVQSMNIDDVTAGLVQMMQKNSGCKPIGSPQAITIGAVQGRSAMLQSTSPFPSPSGEVQNERDWLVAVPAPDGAVIFIIFVAPEAQFSFFEPTFQAMLKSIQLK